MGYGLAASPLLALLDPLFVPVPTILIGCFSATLTAWQEASDIRWNEVVVGSLGRFMGAIVAAFVLLAAVEPSLFSLVFGVCVAVVVGVSIAGWTLPFTRTTLLSMGWLSGLVGTITGVGAPPLAVIYQHRPSSDARPTLAAFFAIGSALSILVLTAIGMVETRHLILCGVLIPSMLLGVLTSRQFLNSMNLDNRYRWALLSVAGTAAFLLIFRGIHGVFLAY